MNTTNAARTAAGSGESPPVRGTERKDAAASTGWDPYEVWRTRVLKNEPPRDAATANNEPPPRPLLIRAG